MENRAKLLGHPIHPMLIVFPLGLLATAILFDLLAIALSGGYGSELVYWMVATGVVTGLLAAPFGAIDRLVIPSGTRARRVGAMHGAGNIVVSSAAGGLALATEWLGGELVDRLAVGVDDGAHLDAPSSLSKRRMGA